MSDALHEFAALAAYALAEITDPDATQHAADEALAALEQHVGSLPREHRQAGKLVAECLDRVQRRDYRDPCGTLTALTHVRTALGYAVMGRAVDMIEAGESLNCARAVAWSLPYEQRELHRLLIGVIDAAKQVIREGAGEKVHGRAA